MKVINAFFRQVDIDRCGGSKPSERAKVKRIVRKRERAIQRTAFARALPFHLADLADEIDALPKPTAAVNLDSNIWQRSRKGHGQRTKNSKKRGSIKQPCFSSAFESRLEFRIEGVTHASCASTQDFALM